MFTVAELIETLKQCPQDYEVRMRADWESYEINSVGIDNDEHTVDLFDI